MLDLDSDNDEAGFKINEGYAKKYEEWRNKEELQKRDINNNKKKNKKIKLTKLILNFS